MPVNGAEQHSCAAVSPHRQQETREGSVFTRAIVKKGWPSPLHRCTTLGAQIVEWSSWLDLISKFARRRLFRPSRELLADKAKSKSLRIGKNVDQQQSSRKIGYRGELHVIPKRHLVLSTSEAFPIRKHGTQSRTEPLRQLVWDRRLIHARYHWTSSAGLSIVMPRLRQLLGGKGQLWRANDKDWDRTVR